MKLLSMAEKARFYWQKAKNKKENERFKKANPDFVLPPEFFVYETYRLNYQWYHDDGKNTAAEIIELLSKHINISDAEIKILDWGCGPGRVVRHFPSLLPIAEIYGTDYNTKYIAWCSDHLKGINFAVNKIDPPTNYSSNFFDVVTGLSIFTHLSEKGHSAWIDELHRIIKKGKLLYITTQGNGYYSKLTEEEKKQFDLKKLVIRAYSNQGNRLYSAFQPKDFMNKLIEGKFKVLEFIEGELKNNEPSQDIWILQKL